MTSPELPILDQSVFEHAAELLSQADGLIIAAGAGMGVDSGLPDFRGNTGFWNAYPALGKAGMDFIGVASPSTFRSDPALAWGFYGHRLQLYRDTAPHPGFSLLKRWACSVPHGAFIFTSNVDGQFQRAGFSEEQIYECHGSIHWLQCSTPCSNRIWPAAAVETDIDNDACRWRGALPSCPCCDSLARPNVLMFGDSAWLAHRADEQESRLHRWLRQVSRPVIVELGAGTRIPSVRTFSHEAVISHGGRLVRINPREPAVPTSLDVGIACGALQGLSAIDACLASSGV